MDTIVCNKLLYFYENNSFLTYTWNIQVLYPRQKIISFMTSKANVQIFFRNIENCEAFTSWLFKKMEDLLTEQ